MTRIAVEIRDKTADINASKAIVIAVIEPVFNRIQNWVSVHKENRRQSINKHEIKMEIDQCLGQKQVAYNNPNETSPNIEALVDVLKLCSKPIFNIFQNNVVVGP